MEKLVKSVIVFVVLFFVFDMHKRSVFEILFLLGLVIFFHFFRYRDNDDSAENCDDEPAYTRTTQEPKPNHEHTHYHTFTRFIPLLAAVVLFAWGGFAAYSTAKIRNNGIPLNVTVVSAASSTALDESRITLEHTDHAGKATRYEIKALSSIGYRLGDAMTIYHDPVSNRSCAGGFFASYMRAIILLALGLAFLYWSKEIFLDNSHT